MRVPVGRGGERCRGRECGHGIRFGLSGAAAVLVLAAVVLPGGVALDAAASSSAHGAGSSGRVIAVTRDRHGVSDIYLARVGGGRLRRLTHSPSSAWSTGDMRPAWSRDGRWIAFVAGRNFPDPEGMLEYQALWVMRSDGSHQRQLTPYAYAELWNPSWSADGRQIVFGRFTYPESLGQPSPAIVAIVDVASGTERRLGTGSPFDFGPSWSPNGRLIAFNHVSGRTGGIWVMRPDGRGGRFLARGDASFPVWSPTGNRIAYLSSRAHYGKECFESGCQYNNEIYVMHRDGSHKRRITRRRADDSSPSWSPDGRFLTFESDGTVRGRLDRRAFVMNADGTCARLLIRERNATIRYPAWQPGPHRPTGPPLSCR
jgi:Tol biopolymer transport system component